MNAIHYPAAGKVPLVILHGLFGSSRNWNTIAKRLATECNIPVYALDVRNHNLSPTNGHSGRMNTWNTLKEDLEQFLHTRLLDTKVSLLGHSIGGQICMASLLSRESRIRERVREAIVVDIGLRHPAPKNIEKDHLYRLMAQMKKINSMKLHSRLDVKRVLGEVEQNIHVVDFLMTNIESSADKTLAFSRLGLEFISDGWPELKSNWEAFRKNFIPWSGKAHFVRGLQSDYVRDSDIADIKHFFPNSEITNIPNAGHWPHFDNPQLFFKILSSILTENKV